jgi:hypothetical protein
MTCNFPYNPTLKGMSYQPNGMLTLQFGKYARTYADVPRELAYKLAYSKTASEVLSVFANQIKKKFKVCLVK